MCHVIYFVWRLFDANQAPVFVLFIYFFPLLCVSNTIIYRQHSGWHIENSFQLQTLFRFMSELIVFGNNLHCVDEKVTSPYMKTQDNIYLRRRSSSTNNMFAIFYPLSFFFIQRVTHKRGKWAQTTLHGGS